MAKPPSGTDVVAQWAVDATAWREFVQQVRAHGQGRKYVWYPKLRDDAPDADRSVVVGNDGIWLGDECFDFAQAEEPRLVTHSTWLEFTRAPEGGFVVFPVPLPRGEQTQVALGVGYAGERIERNRQEAERRHQAYLAERARPTLNNRLLNLVEGHFVAMLLLFFFVLLPAVSLLAAWLAGEAWWQ